MQIVMRLGDIPHHRHEDPERCHHADEEDHAGHGIEDLFQPAVAFDGVGAQLRHDGIEVGPHALAGDRLHAGEYPLRDRQREIGEEVEAVRQADDLRDILSQRTGLVCAIPQPGQRRRCRKPLYVIEDTGEVGGRLHCRAGLRLADGDFRSCRVTECAVGKVEPIDGAVELFLDAFHRDAAREGRAGSFNRWYGNAIIADVGDNGAFGFLRCEFGLQTGLIEHQRIIDDLIRGLAHRAESRAEFGASLCFARLPVDQGRADADSEQEAGHDEDETAAQIGACYSKRH